MLHENKNEKSARQNENQNQKQTLHENKNEKQNQKQTLHEKQNPKQTSCMKRKIQVANKSSCSMNNQKCQLKSQNFLSQGVKNSKSTNSNILSKEVLKRTSLQPPR